MTATAEEPRYGYPGEGGYWPDEADPPEPERHYFPREGSELKSSLSSATLVAQPGRWRVWGAIRDGEGVYEMGELTTTHIVIQFCEDGSVRVGGASGRLFGADSLSRAPFRDRGYLAEASSGETVVTGNSGVIYSREKASRGEPVSIFDLHDGLAPEVVRILNILELLQSPQSILPGAIQDLEADMNALFEEYIYLREYVWRLLDQLSGNIADDTDDGVVW